MQVVDDHRFGELLDDKIRKTFDAEFNQEFKDGLCCNLLFDDLKKVPMKRLTFLNRVINWLKGIFK